MKKVGTITFHSSYNFGSNLQAYAMQEYIKKIGKKEISYNVINFRTNFQKEIYKTSFERKGYKDIIKRVILYKEKKDIINANKRFEEFINNYLQITDEFSSDNDLNNSDINFDYYISGSDQIWNLNTADFCWSYFLEFAKFGKRISYAASFGPRTQIWTDVEKERIKKDLAMYDAISVREQASYNNIKDLVEKPVSINIDPTMLLTKNEWLKIIDSKKMVEGDYILLYNLQGKKDVYELANKISKLLNIPIIVPNVTMAERRWGKCKRVYDCGPLEFLNLVNNAKLVLSSSFHGTIFSILLNTPFFAINGMKDNRICMLLEKLNLTNRSIEQDNIEERIKKAFEIDFSKVESQLELERKNSENYLRKALELS